MSAPRIVLAIDGGGSSTTACLAQGADVLASVDGPASNPAQAGADACCQIVRELTQAALQAVGMNHLDHVVIGLAGIEAVDCRQQLRSTLHTACGVESTAVVTDIALLLDAAPANVASVAIVSGTGSVCMGRNAAGARRRVGGRGYLVGDEGSGFWLGQQAVAAALRAMDQLGEPTAFTRLMSERWNSDDAASWTQAIYSDPKPRQLFASFAPDVFRLAKEGDTVATQLITAAARHLADHIQAVTAQLDIADGDYQLLLAGSVLVHAEWLRVSLNARLEECPPAPSTTRVIRSPAEAAAISLASQDSS